MKSNTIIFLIAAVVIVLIYFYYTRMASKQIVVTGPTGTQPVFIMPAAINNNKQLTAGYKGPEVQILQIWLNDLGANIHVNWIMDSDTIAALENQMAQWSLTWNGGITLKQFEGYADAANMSVAYLPGNDGISAGLDCGTAPGWVSESGGKAPPIFFSSN